MILLVGLGFDFFMYVCSISFLHMVHFFSTSMAQWAFGVAKEWSAHTIKQKKFTSKIHIMEVEKSRVMLCMRCSIGSIEFQLQEQGEKLE